MLSLSSATLNCEIVEAETTEEAMQNILDFVTLLVVAIFTAAAAAAVDWLLLQGAFRLMRPAAARHVTPAAVRRVAVVAVRH